MKVIAALPRCLRLHRSRGPTPARARSGVRRLTILARAAGAASIAILVISCSHPPGPLQISFDRDGVAVAGLSSAELSSFRRARLTEDAWHNVFAVSVRGGGLPMAGKYSIESLVVRFSPAFPLDPGHTYLATFNPERMPSPRHDPPIESILSLAGPDLTPSTVVSQIYPEVDVWPENMLRFYIQFSAPMSRAGAGGLIRLLDDKGQEVPQAFLPVEADFWSPDQTRYTVFFDPGRVKSGILPNEQLGRALRPGRNYSIDLDVGWKDAAGRPLKTGYRRSFRAGPADERPIDIQTWKLMPPRVGTRDPFMVDFLRPLDHGIASRALSIKMASGFPIAGIAGLRTADSTWTWTPSEPWIRGEYELVVQSILEDLAGNRVGRPFEVAMPDKPDRRTPAEQVSRTFAIR